MMKSLLNLINTWYFRYLLVTELYIVEKWERVMIHIVFVILFVILSIFNNCVVLALIANIMSNYGNVDHTINYSSKVNVMSKHPDL